MEPVFNQALKAGHVGGFSTVHIYNVRVSRSLKNLTNILADDNLGVLFNNGVCNKKCSF